MNPSAVEHKKSILDESPLQDEFAVGIDDAVTWLQSKQGCGSFHLNFNEKDDVDSMYDMIYESYDMQQAFVLCDIIIYLPSFGFA